MGPRADLQAKPAHDETLLVALRRTPLDAAPTTDEHQCREDDHGDDDEPDIEHENPFP